MGYGGPFGAEAAQTAKPGCEIVTMTIAARAMAHFLRRAFAVAAKLPSAR